MANGYVIQIGSKFYAGDDKPLVASKANALVFDSYLEAHAEANDVRDTWVLTADGGETPETVKVVTA